MYLPFYIILSMKYLSTNPQSMQKCSLRDNEVLFHMIRQKHTIEIKSKDHPSISVNKKVNFKHVNINNRYEIWQFAGMLNVLILYLINLFNWKTTMRLLEVVVNSLYTKTGKVKVFFLYFVILQLYLSLTVFCTINVLTKISFFKTLQSAHQY